MSRNTLFKPHYRSQHDVRLNDELDGQAQRQSPTSSNYFGHSSHSAAFTLEPRLTTNDRSRGSEFSRLSNTSSFISHLTRPHESTFSPAPQQIGQTIIGSPSSVFWQTPAPRIQALHKSVGAVQSARSIEPMSKPATNIYQHQSERSPYKEQSTYAKFRDKLPFLQKESPTTIVPHSHDSSHDPNLQTNSFSPVYESQGQWSSPAELVSSPTKQPYSRLATPPTQGWDLLRTSRLEPIQDDSALLKSFVYGSPSANTRGDVSADLPIAVGNAVSRRIVEGPPIINGIQLVPTSTLPDRLRQIFPFGLFNAIQSKCFSPVFSTNDNMVVSAPTGGGKTVVLELAICRLVQNQRSNDFKIVYQAPTKSLCGERARDWHTKFRSLGLECAELTGDTDASEMRRVASASIIITTPEKWDSITRKWSDHEKLLRMVRLLLIDEVHIVADTRGATLEAVVSRMRTIGAHVRMVALSATIPNSNDVAAWLGKSPTTPDLPAHREVFGEEFRPVVLQKYVHGYDSNGNDFSFESKLDKELPSLIAQYTQKKPMIVFCFTRKSCEHTAEMLNEWWRESKPGDRAWAAPRQPITTTDKSLSEIVGSGVAFHHAGLDLADRHKIESAYGQGDINVIVCTSTLAVGVNLPCHMVVIKGTMGYGGGTLREYPDLEIQQMLGRAGRPQFGTDAVAIIMTQKTKVDRYQAMSASEQTLESMLHLNLIEHLNSEVTLGTVSSLPTAKQWLSSTFLAVRLKQNPIHYDLGSAEVTSTAARQLENVCERDMRHLQDADLVTQGPQIKSTEYGHIMSKLMISFLTMTLLLDVPFASKMGTILTRISEAQEFDEIRMKPAERNVFRELNKSNLLRFPLKETVSTQAHKVVLLIQARLGDINIPFGKGYSKMTCIRETNIALEHASRLIRCVVECKAHASDAVTTIAASELARSIRAGIWEYSPHQLRQLPQVGPIMTRKLIGSNIKTVHELMRLSSADVERILSRNPPFGSQILDAASSFPKLSLRAAVVEEIVKRGENPKLQIQAKLAFENEKIPRSKMGTPSVSFIATNFSGRVAYTWSGSLTSVAKDKVLVVSFSVEMLCESDYVSCHFFCDSIVGTTKTTDIRPDFPPSAFVLTIPKQQLPTFKKPVAESDWEKDMEDEFADEDMLSAMESIEPHANRSQTPQILQHQNSSSADDFVDIDEVESEIDSTTFTHTHRAKTEADLAQPIQMANGKWECNHDCRNGKLIKGNKVCRHRCCKEGLDRPIKPKKRKVKSDVQESENKKLKVDRKGSTKEVTNMTKSEKKLPFTGAIHHSGKVARLDMADDVEKVKYEDIGPRDYRKLHALHTKVQNNNHFDLLPKTRPQFPYTAGEKPDLPCLRRDRIVVNREVKDPSDCDIDSGWEMDSPSLGTQPLSLHNEIDTESSHVNNQPFSDKFGEWIEDFDVAMADGDSQTHEDPLATRPTERSTAYIENPAVSQSERMMENLDRASDIMRSAEQWKPQGHSVFQETMPLVNTESDAGALGHLGKLNTTPTASAAKTQKPVWTQEFDPNLVEFLGTYCDFEPDSCSEEDDPGPTISE